MMDMEWGMTVPPPGLMDCNMPAVDRASGCMGTEFITKINE
jgi:hypothetical protein